MAEFVNQSIEDMLPELEQMERIRLFTKDETRRILKKRQRLEYRLRKKTKMEEDYLNYIEYETNLLTLIKKRRQSTGYNFKKLEIDIPIVHRIHRLFQLCETRFPNSVDVWLQHIEFSKKRKEFERVSRTFTTLLRILNKIPELWVKAAQWEMEQSSLDVARELMQRGISFNSTSQFLWVEYYKMELQITDMLRKGSQLTQLSQEEDPTLNGTIAMIVLKNAFQQFPDDLDMLLSCIKVSQNYDFARSQLDQMLLDLRSRFSHVSRMWDQLARRFLPVKNGKIAQNVTKEDEEHCYTVFQQAVTEAPSMETWSFYLKTCLELISLPSAVSRKEQRVSHILEVFSAAEKQRLLSVEMFQEWARVLTETLQVNEAERVVQMGLKLYPKSTPLWRKLLVLHFQTLRSPDDVVICLMRALDSVPEKESWDLWQPTLEYLVEQKYDNFQSLLQKATMRPCRDVCQPAKVYHLHWAFLSSSIKAARDVYKELSRIKPVPLQFYLDYVNMELSQSVVNMKRVRRAMEEAILDHGHSEPELWLRFIKIEMSDGNSGLVGDLHFRATSSLDGAYLDYFIQNYPSVCCASNV